MADGFESWLNGWATPAFIGYWIIVGPFLLMGLVYLAGTLWQGWDANRANQPIYAAAEARRIARAAARRNNREGEA